MSKANGKLSRLLKDNKCKDFCPLECESTEYRISESKFSLNDFRNSTMYGSQFIPGIQKKLNITVNSTEEFNKNYLQINIFFDSLKSLTFSKKRKRVYPFIYVSYNSHEKKLADMIYIFQNTNL